MIKMSLYGFKGLILIYSGPRQSPVDGNFSFHEFDDQTFESALGEGFEEDLD